jgi:hypothetical protein
VAEQRDEIATGEVFADGEETEGSVSSPFSYSALPDTEPLYRLINYTNHISKDGKVKRNVFMRRPPHPETGAERDTKGLSVTLRNGREEETTCRDAAAKMNDISAVCRIGTGDVRAVAVAPPLDVIQDEPDHANIVRLPRVPPADIATEEGIKQRAYAELVGGELAQKAAIVWKPK